MTTPIGWDDVGGIVFDAVGTLIEPTPSVAEVYAAAARRRGVALDVALVKDRFRKNFRDDEQDETLGPLVTDEPGEARRWRRIVGRVLPELPDPDAAFAELWDHFGRPGSWRTFDDVGPAFDALESAGVPFRIASNFDGRLRGVLDGLPATSGRGGARVISSEVGHRKPHPRFYRAACASLGLPPARVLCVGDDPENDVLGPARAGLQGLLIDRDGTGPGEIPRLPDLAALVDRLLGAFSGGRAGGGGPGGR